MSTEAPARATNLVDLLDQLVPPTEPTPISMAPETFGWWVVLALLACALAYGVWRYVLYRRRTAYRRAALRALAAAGQDAAALAAILRRTALAAYPRAEVAGLSGEAWLAFLDDTGGTRDFRHGPGAVLARAPYDGTAVAPPDVVAAAERWITRHRGARAGGRL